MNIIINAGREKSLLRRHPWIFASAIKSMDQEIASGSTIDLLSSEGKFLARASYSPTSQIRARVWTFNDEPVDKEFFRRKIKSAIELRRMSGVESHTNAYRLIHAESDGLPGFVVDRY
jgi:23S rRNA (cytosine1962-C5)-methyltransferase